MKKYLLLGFSLLMLSARLPAQSGINGNLNAASTDCTVTNACLSITVPQNSGGATIKLSGTFSATVQFEASGDPPSTPLASVTWVALSATPSNSSTTATSSTTAGVWQANVSGYTHIRVRVSTYASGTVAAAINLSTASARVGTGGGGGGIGGTITSPHLVYASGADTLSDILGSSVTGATGATVFTAGADTTTPITLIEHSGTQSAPLLQINAGPAATYGCADVEAVTGLNPFCVDTGTTASHDPAIIGNNPALWFFDTSTNAPSLLKNGWIEQQGQTLALYAQSNSTSSYILINEAGHEHDIGLYASNPDPWVYWGSNGAGTWTGGINTLTGEIAAGWAANSKTGFFSILDGVATHKISIKNPGTMAADYELDLPITAGTAGQFLTSQGGAGTPMTWSSGFTGSITNQVANGLPYNSGGVATAIDAAVTAPATNGQYTCGYTVTSSVSVHPTCPQVGVVDRVISGATSTDAIGSTTVNDAAGIPIIHDVAGSASVAVTLPTPTTLSNAGAIINYIDNSSHTDTITPTTWTIMGASSWNVYPNEKVSITVDQFNATNWVVSAVPLMDSSGNATLIKVTGARNGIGSTTADAFLALNSTAAAAGTPQYSPSMHWKGYSWTGSASVPIDFYSYVQTTTGGTGIFHICPFVNSVAGSCLNFASYGTLQFPTIQANILGNNVTGATIYNNTAPTIAVGGCGGSAASIVSNNGTAAFKVNVGTSNTGSCTITMPAATTDWVCGATDITTTSTAVSQTKVKPGGTPTTQITLQNYTDLSATGAWTDSDVIAVRCSGE